MKHIPTFLLALVALLTGCAATEQGPGDSQKTLLAETAARWAELYNQHSFDVLETLYADRVDFNGRQVSATKAAQAMDEFLSADQRFRPHFDDNSWVLDSMKADIYAGHITGLAHYDWDHQDSMEISVNLWMRLPESGSPQIVAQSDQLGTAQTQLKRHYRDRIMAGQDFDSTGAPNYYFWEELLETAGPKLGTVAYCTKYEGKRLIYARDKGQAGKMGIFDEQGEATLAAEFDDIGGIGIFLPGAVEVRKGEKYGLLKIDGTRILPVAYDAILPVFDQPEVALWASKDGQWSAHDATGQAVVAEGGSTQAGPDWVSYIRSLPLKDKWNPQSPSFQGTYISSFSGEDNEERLNEIVIFRAPFSLVQRGVLQDTHLSNDESELDTKSQQSIQDVSLFPDGNIRLLSEIETWGVGGRESYHNVETEWVVFEPELKDTVQKLSLVVRELESYHGCEIGAINMIGDSLLQVTSSGNLLEYWEMPTYRYFQIQSNAQLKPLLTDRDFPMMSVRLIDAKFFQGCFVGTSKNSEAKQWLLKQEAETRKLANDIDPKDETTGLVERKSVHMRGSDLDYLVNEVYASHGYIFQKEKWKTYYAAKKWYQPRATEVESLLTPIERANIDFVRKIQGEMAGQEIRFTKPEYSLAEYW